MPPEAVLLYHGGVLMQPTGGRRNPRSDFDATVLRHTPEVTTARFAAGIAAGDAFLNASDGRPDRDEYRPAVPATAGVEATSALPADLRRPVAPAEVLEVFPDVIGEDAELESLPRDRRAGTLRRAAAPRRPAGGRLGRVA